MKKIIAFCLALAVAVGLTACGTADQVPENTPENTPTAPVQSQEPESGETVRYTDSLGREVEVPARITRIVPSAPLGQMYLYALCPEYFVGTADEWDKDFQAFMVEDYPDLPVVGQLYGGKGELNLETLAMVAPQVIIDVGEAKKGTAEELDELQQQLNIPCIHVNADMKTAGEAVDSEQLMLWDPEVIFFSPEVDLEEVAADPAWTQLQAIRNGNYHKSPEGPYNWMGFPPSVNRYLGMYWMAAILYPNQVEWKLYDKVSEYYDLFYHVELTEEYFHELTGM